MREVDLQEFAKFGIRGHNGCSSRYLSFTRCPRSCPIRQRPDTFKGREQYRNFTEAELSTLWAKLRGIEWDVDLLDEFHTVLVEGGGERVIKRLPTPMTVELARLTPEQTSEAAAKWAATDEMAYGAADVQPIVEGLVRLAKAASETGRNLYFWNCV